MLRAWAKFDVKDKRLIYDESFAECQKAAKMAPHAAASHLFMGHMSKIVGDTAKAKKGYEACLGH